KQREERCIAPGTWDAQIIKFKFQTATPLRSRAAARGGVLVDLPLFEGRWSAERRALVVTKAPFGRSIAGFMAKGPLFRGLGCLAARRFPAAACPRPANFSGRAS